MNPLIKLKELILDLLFPPKCIFCGTLLSAAEFKTGICPDCMETLPYLEEREDHFDGDSFIACYSLLPYRNPVSHSIRRYKFRGCHQFSRHYGTMLRLYLESSPLGQQHFDLITWAPLSKKRLSDRGYDQAYLLAKEVATHWDQSPVSLLKKIRQGETQSHLTAHQRWENAKNKYRLTDDASVEGKRILLIDDVTTSGSTLEACSRELVAGGAAEVFCLTLARSGQGKKTTNLP